MVTVKEIMTTELYTLGPEDTLQDAHLLMTKKHIRHIPIVDSPGHLVGLVSQRDVLAATMPELLGFDEDDKRRFENNVRLNEVMKEELYTVDEHADVRKAAIYLQEHHFGCLPVVSNGTLNGIVTDADFVNVAVNLLEQAEAIEPTAKLDDDFEEEFSDED